MVKLLMGLKGSGKTKRLIDMIKQSVESEHGDIVCLEQGSKLTYDVPHKARLIFANQYPFGSYDFLKGFLSGLNASNYDISHIFIDSLQKVVDAASLAELENFLVWLAAFSEKENVKFTITLSADPATATEGIQKFF